MNVEVDEGDRDSFRFLWPVGHREGDLKIMLYRFCRVEFGSNASPFLLNGPLRHHLSHYMEVGPVFVVKMIEGFSVGDLVTDENSVESGHILQVKANKD